MNVVYLCSCVFPGTKYHNVDKNDADEELEHLIELGMAPANTPGKKKPDTDIYEMLDALDVFKGVLVIFMTYSHVDLVLVNPSDALYGRIGHFVGNIASSMCFLGFMFSYGFACDCMYISDWKKRGLTELCSRVFRSICLVLIGALVCSFSWSFLCFKFPFTFDMVMSLLTFYNLVGNGPDFIISFATMLLIMFPLRDVINHYWEKSIQNRELLISLMLILPLCLTFFTVQDCTGRRKYINMFLACHQREAWNANLSALPHLFYFNIGLICSRLLREYGFKSFTHFLAIMLGTVFSFLAIPLYSTWNMNWGNVMAETDYGMVTRGFVDGPSMWWLVGNLFSLYLLLITCVAFNHMKVALWLNNELQHLGANILLYLVVADIILAGAYRAQATPQDASPLSAFPGGFLVTLGILATTRFLHYMAQSSRK